MKPILLLTFVVLALQFGNAQDYVAKGKLALSARDTTIAISNFKEALSMGQKSAEANYYLGVIAYARHKLDDAVNYLTISLKVLDENVDALKMMGDISMERADVQAALTYYRRAVKFGPKSGAANIVYGRALLAADSVDASIVYLTRAKEFTPDDPVIYAALGDAYLKQNVLVLAISNYQRALELNPRNFELHFRLARVFAKNKQYTDAVKEYDAVTTIDSVYADAYLEKGRIYVLAKLFRQAIAPMKTYIRLRPKSAEGMGLLAKAYFGADDFADAAVTSQQALQLDSSNVDMWRVNAYSLTETKDFTSALKGFAALKRRNMLKSEDQGKFGSALVGAGREDDALQALLAAVAADTTNCDPYFPLGFLYMKRQDYEKAAVMFEKKIACDPRSLSAYVNAAASHMQRKNFSRAGELLLRVVELKPDFLQGRLWLARYYAQVDSLDKAKEQYDAVLKEIGSNTEKYKKEAGEAHSLTGSYYFLTQRYGNAVESFRKALSFGYENAGMQLSWGQALLQLLDRTGDQAENRKKIEESMKHFRRCTELEANSAQAHLWLAQALVMMRVEGDNEGNKKLQEEACNEYRKVLKLDPRNEDAKKGMERIGCQGTAR